jgi:hypothetical protein
MSGGWVPPNFPGLCVGANPFPSGGVCINGGWIPSNMGGSPAPAPADDPPVASEPEERAGLEAKSNSEKPEA